MKQFKYFSVILTLAVVLCACQSKTKTPVKPIEISFTKEAELSFIKDTDTIVHLDIELAESDYEQQTGLMHRSSMDMKKGMLFVYEDERPRPSFYMKNTQIALDLIYINTEMEVVEINRDAKPYDETPIRAYQPAKYVLEVNGGFADTYKITDSVTVYFNRLKQ